MSFHRRPAPVAPGEVYSRQIKSEFDMLQRIAEHSTSEQWVLADGNTPIWQQMYHALFWTSAWLRSYEEPLALPDFHRNEYRDMDKGASPVLGKHEMARYLETVKQDSMRFLASIQSGDFFTERVVVDRIWTTSDIVVGQIRHLQHHIGNMNAVLRRSGGRPEPWHGYNEHGLSLEWYGKCVLKE